MEKRLAERIFEIDFEYIHQDIKQKFGNCTVNEIVDSRFPDKVIVEVDLSHESHEKRKIRHFFALIDKVICTRCSNPKKLFEMCDNLDDFYKNNYKR